MRGLCASPGGGTGVPGLGQVAFTRLGFAGDAGALGTGLRVIHAAAEHARVEVPADCVAATLTLSGTTHVTSADGSWDLQKGRLLLWNEGVVLRSGRHARWLMLVGAASDWRVPGTRVDVPLPEDRAVPRDVMRLMLRLARRARDGRADVGAAAADMMEAFWDLQAPLRTMTDRCTGRTHGDRKRMMLRLLKLRHTIQCTPGQAFDLDAMCRMTHYSPWHLARVFRAVFDESPVQFATRRRLQYAYYLVLRTTLPFVDVAEATGFESQSAFNRAFRGLYATTPTAVRLATRPTTTAAGCCG